jgi:hypothetical protein
MTGRPVMKPQHPSPIVAGVGACYLLGVLGYVLGMTLSALGYVPAGLVIICAAAALAIALFRPGVSPSPCARLG